MESRRNYWGCGLLLRWGEPSETGSRRKLAPRLEKGLVPMQEVALSGEAEGGWGEERSLGLFPPASCEDVLILRQCCHTRIAPFKQRLKRNFSMHLLSLHVCLFIQTAQEHYLFYPFLIFPAHCWLTSDGVSLLWHAVCGEKGQRHFATKASKGCQGLGRC